MKQACRQTWPSHQHVSSYWSDWRECKYWLLNVLLCLLFSGGCNQYYPSWTPEDAVPQNKNCGHQYSPLRSHSPHPQQRVHVIPV